MPTTTNYIWDEENLLAEADNTNAINILYTNEPRRYGNLISTRLDMTSTPSTAYHHFDAIGSTRQLANVVGHVTDTANYDTWGNVITRSGTTGVSLLWIGQVRLLLRRRDWPTLGPNAALSSDHRALARSRRQTPTGGHCPFIRLCTEQRGTYQRLDSSRQRPGGKSSRIREPARIPESAGWGSGSAV